jgi:hypothetical protein
MLDIRSRPLPPDALLLRYKGAGAYTDCYETVVSRPVSHGEYVEAFYTTWVFRLERLILRWLASRPSTDAQVRELARGERNDLAAWSVEGRTLNQLLLCDFMGRTRSWLMVQPLSGGSTRLLFGSAVVPIRDKKGQWSLGASYSSLLGFHKMYSRILLAAARSRLRASMHA